VGDSRDQRTVLSGGVGRRDGADLIGPGDVVGGYRVEAPAGEGGMGVVWRAREAGLDRLVALKVIRPDHASAPGFRESFIRESRLAASLEHPNVIPVYRADEDGGLLYIAMRWVEGETLEDLIARDGRLPPARAARILAQVAGALDAAHERGLIHRDVKPANVLIADPDGEEHVYLTDFGLSIRGADGEDPSTGRWAGTPGYLAPEQIRGGRLDARADVYALGCVLFRALTGRAPFVGAGQEEVLAAHLTEPPPTVTDLVPGAPPALDDVVRTALAKSPDDRFASAGDLARRALAARFDVYLCHHPADREAVGAVADLLEADGLLPWLESRQGPIGGDRVRARTEALRGSDACAVVIGRDGLGEWAREELAAAQDVAAHDRAFGLLTVLLPGAPEPFDPSLALLAARPWVDLRDGLEDPDARRALIRSVRGESRAAEPGAAVTSVECPYRGLEAFDEDHADLFFGREAEVAQALERLRTARFLAVLGASGSGKSSLIRAGIIPALRRGAVPGSDRWIIRTFAPGPHPLAALAAQIAQAAAGGAPELTPDDLLAGERALDVAAAACLPDAENRLLLVVDQLEEVWTLCARDGERTAFLRNLRYAATIPGGPVVVLLSLRADFYHRCAEDPELRALVASQQLLLGPLGPEGLRRAIEEPARHSGLEPGPGLTRRILADVADRPGALPLLEHLLFELWRRRRGRTLTLEDYVASGGVEGALAKRADAVYAGLDPDAQRVARRVLLRLVQPGEATEDTRRRAELSELLTAPEEESRVRAVVSAMAEARLLTTGRDEASGAAIVEITHEALIRGWPELRGWIDEERESLRLQHRLTEAAREWESGGRDEGMLYRGARLGAWQERDLAELSDLERAFLEAGRAREARERAAGRRRLRLILAGLAAALAAITAVAIVAVVQRNEAADERDLARSRQIAASARAELPDDPELAVLLARRAYGVRPTVEAEDVLRQAVAVSTVRAAFRGSRGPVTDAAFSPAGRAVVSGGDDGAVRVWEPGSGRSVTLTAGGGPIRAVAFSPDGRLVAAGDVDGRVRLWDWRPRRLVGRMRLPSAVNPQQYVGGIAFTAGGSLLVVGGGAGVLRLVRSGGGRVGIGGAGGVAVAWDWAARRVVAVRRIPDGIVSVAADRAGDRVLLGGANGSVTIWDALHRRQPRRLVGPARSPSAASSVVAIDPAGRIGLQAPAGGAVRGWSLPGLAGMRLPRTPTVAFTLALSPDGRHAVSAGAGGTVMVWDLAGVDPTVALRGHAGAVGSAAFSPNGQEVVTAGDDGTVRVWAWRQAQPMTLAAGRSPVLALAFSPDGRALAEASADQSGRRWRLGDERSTLTLPPAPSAILSAAIAANGGRTAWGDYSGTVGVTARGRELATATLHTEGVDAVALTADGRRVASGGDDGTVQVWDESSAAPAVMTGSRGSVLAVAFSPDGRLVASGGRDGTVRVWDPSRRRAIAALHGHRDGVDAVAFSPDGRLVASGGEDGTVRVWDWADGRALAELRGHRGAVQAVAFGPDGRLVASGGEDGTARVWRWEGGVQALVVSGGRGAVGAVALSPGSRLVAGAGQDGIVRLWRCEACGSMPRVLALAKARVTRDLTPSERQLFLDSP
jgi:WD40 repeat protein